MRDENDDLASDDDSSLSDVEEEGSDEDGDDAGSNQMQWVPRKPEWNRTQGRIVKKLVFPEN